MISPMLIITLLASAAPPAVNQANLAQARTAYSRCLSGLLRTNLKDKVAPDAFEATLTNSCKTEEATFRRAVVTTDVATGTSRASAEQGANFEIGDIVANTKANYQGYLETDTLPR